MQILAERYVVEFKKLNTGRNILNYFHIKIHAAQQPKGTPQDYTRFLGEYPEGFIDTNIYTISDDVNGLIYALVCPPYSLSNKTGFTDKRAFYTDVVQKYQEHLLGVKKPDDTQALIITAWSTDWSNYFDAGKEWWGSFCWTLYDQRNHSFIFIAASATD